MVPFEMCQIMLPTQEHGYANCSETLSSYADNN